MKNEIITILDENIKVINDLKSQASLIVKIVNEIINAYKNNKKIVLFGNGGSAADAQHIAAEFVGKFYKDRDSLPALAFHTNTSVVTATANDYGYEYIFERQVSSFVNEGDIAIGISTSGNSPNVIKGIEKAKQKGAVTIGFTGQKKNKLENIVDYCLKIPSTRVIFSITSLYVFSTPSRTVFFSTLSFESVSIFFSRFSSSSSSSFTIAARGISPPNLWLFS